MCLCMYVDMHLSVCVCVCMCMYVCLDLTDLSSFDRAKFWVNELKQTEEV